MKNDLNQAIVWPLGQSGLALCFEPQYPSGGRRSQVAVSIGPAGEKRSEADVDRETETEDSARAEDVPEGRLQFMLCRDQLEIAPQTIGGIPLSGTMKLLSSRDPDIFDGISVYCRLNYGKKYRSRYEGIAVTVPCTHPQKDR